MKRTAFSFMIGLLTLSVMTTRPVLAQTETPPAGPTGKVIGTIINQNTGATVTGGMDVMLHILDQDYAEAGMLHGQSQADGTFLFSDVPFDANSHYAVMAIYDGVTYFSDTVPSNMTSLEAEIDVPVYESTSDLMNVQVDQMHVLFGVAEDGLEIKEIYAFSNTGERTVKNVYELGSDQFATLEFPLPKDADNIFFKPEDKDRFVKLSGRFADTYPILPGTQSSQLMASYLVPYSGKRNYTYTAPINIVRINFLVPDQADISLKGLGLKGPESMTLQNGESYLVYSYTALNAGQTVSVSISGKTVEAGSNKNANTSIAIGAALLGFAVLGVGVWWWRSSDDTDEETDLEIDTESDKSTLDELIVEIARLDEEHEQGSLSSEEHQRQRQNLMQRAKRLL